MQYEIKLATFRNWRRCAKPDGAKGSKAPSPITMSVISLGKKKFL